MNISLALSGGAARGAFHLGVLQALEENNIDIAAISGSSIGAIIGMSYACGISPKEQLEIFQSKAFKKAFKFNNFKNGFLRIDKQKAVLRELVPLEYIQDSKIKIHITTIDLHSGQIVRFDKGATIPICAASSALIPLFKPIKYQGKYLVDGGIMDNLPIAPLQQYGFPIFGVDLHPQEEGFQNTFKGIMKRTLFLMWRASVQEQIHQCDLYITNQNLSKYNLFRFKNMTKIFTLGYDTALPLTQY